MQVTTAANTGPADNRTASHSASRQQQSGSNLHLIPRAPVTGGVTSNTKVSKLASLSHFSQLVPAVSAEKNYLIESLHYFHERGRQFYPF